MNAQKVHDDDDGRAKTHGTHNSKLKRKFQLVFFSCIEMKGENHSRTSPWPTASKVHTLMVYASSQSDRMP